MSVCDCCKKELKISFICNSCGGRYCKNHRQPEAHLCKSLKKESLELISRASEIKGNKFIQNAELNMSAHTNTSQEKEVQEFVSEERNDKQPLMQQYASPIFFICVITIIACVTGILFLI